MKDANEKKNNESWSRCADVFEFEKMQGSRPGRLRDFSSTGWPVDWHVCQGPIRKSFLRHDKETAVDDNGAKMVHRGRDSLYFEA